MLKVCCHVAQVNDTRQPHSLYYSTYLYSKLVGLIKLIKILIQYSSVLARGSKPPKAP